MPLTKVKCRCDTPAAYFDKTGREVDSSRFQKRAYITAHNSRCSPVATDDPCTASSLPIGSISYDNHAESRYRSRIQPFLSQRDIRYVACDSPLCLSVELGIHDYRIVSHD